MKKEQEKFMASIADDKTPLTFMGKMIREYVRMTLKAKDIVSIHYDGADAGEGLALADGSIVPPQTPEIFSIVSADQHRLKTIVTQGRVHELHAPAPFLVQQYWNIMESPACVSVHLFIPQFYKSRMQFPDPAGM